MTIDRFDYLLKIDGPVAIIVKEELEPVAGDGTVFFPPTFAPPKGAPKDTKAQYIINSFGDCLVDTVGSQGNRLEPMFKREPLNSLVPEVTINIGERSINLLDVGHRAADAVVRFSMPLGGKLAEAFATYQAKGTVDMLAKIAPTSLIFGVWDSRGSKAKLPRLVESTVRASGSKRHTRGAQYFSALEPNDYGAEKYTTDLLSKHGFQDAPSGESPGGVTAQSICRDAILNLIALRALNGQDPKVLRRYIFGLALLTILAPSSGFLRQGCLLVTKLGTVPLAQVAERDGVKAPLVVSYDDALAFARLAATAFGVGENQVAAFDPVLANKFLTDQKKKAKLPPANSTNEAPNVA